LPQFAVLPGLQKRIKWALPVLAWLVCLATARPALAQGVPGTLVEIDLGRFIILGPVEVEAELYAFAQARGPALNAAYDVLAPLYGATPVIPINIRVYADRVEFAKLNAIVPPLADNAIHTHLGSREIALILPFPSGYLASGEAVNAIRHELSGLLLSTLSANRMPAGLELGFNQYVEAPGPQTERAVARLQAALDSATFGPLFSWRSLFEGTQVYSNTGVAYSQSLSIAAFLIETYGYDRVRILAEALGEGQSYSSALAATYGQPLDRLEQEWLTYLPHYIAERWQYNVLYNFDLRPYQAGLEAGAYAQVGAALDAVMPLLTLSGQTDALVQAEDLRAWAAEGAAAEALVQAQREALLNGDYERVLSLGREAQAAYGALGDTRRVHEIQDQIERAQDILDLRAELAAAQDQGAAGQVDAAEAALVRLVPEFERLGDTQSADAARDAINALYTEREQDSASRQAQGEQLLLLSGALVALAGLQAVLLRLWARRRQAPEIL
jgi:hypothetical protein